FNSEGSQFAPPALCSHIVHAVGTEHLGAMNWQIELQFPRFGGSHCSPGSTMPLPQSPPAETQVTGEGIAVVQGGGWWLSLPTLVRGGAPSAPQVNGVTGGGGMVNDPPPVGDEVQR